MRAALWLITHPTQWTLRATINTATAAAGERIKVRALRTATEQRHRTSFFCSSRLSQAISLFYWLVVASGAKRDLGASPRLIVGGGGCCHNMQARDVYAAAAVHPLSVRLHFGLPAARWDISQDHSARVSERTNTMRAVEPRNCACLAPEFGD